jgi:hypothetical protein
MVGSPALWMSTGSDLDSAFRTLMADLEFVDGIDERPGIVESYRSYGQFGVVGPFRHTFGEGRFLDEVASVHAEWLHAAGCLPVRRTLDVEHYTELAQTARNRFDGRDFRRSDVERIVGEPSIEVGRDVICYAGPPGADGWIFFDFDGEAERARPYEFGEGRYRGGDHPAPGDRVLRDVRLPASRWHDGLVLTLYGKVKRGGPGWWIDEPGDGPNSAIAAMLRDIRDQDPSQRRL